ncbi:MAG: DUF302 domain-containing protein [Gammaproteobacteria bacterium]|nr:DUF302 domain-containing protein [Gammaproteobacteria bacterium]
MLSIQCFSFNKFLFRLIIALFISGNVSAERQYVNTTIIEGEYHDVLSSVKEIIQGKGINIAHTLPAGDMLGRTGPAFNIKEKVYLNAETVEFCSAKISHQLVQANVENIVLCPFTISVYVLASDPKHVRISTPEPFIIDDKSKEAVENMKTLVSEIIQEAAEW